MPRRKKEALPVHALPKREDLLAWLLEVPGEASTGPLDDARKRFHETLKSGTAFGPVEWLFNQLIGTPRSTIVQTIEDKEVLGAVCRVTARYLGPEQFDAWWAEVRSDLERGSNR
jgi:hypothetical protein